MRALLLFVVLVVFVIGCVDDGGDSHAVATVTVPGDSHAVATVTVPGDSHAVATVTVPGDSHAVATVTVPGGGDEGGSTVEDGPAVNAITLKYTFYKFTDPNENAFTIQIPRGWGVREGSGLVRPYIDAGVLLEAGSPKRGFYYASPYRVYNVPNKMLDLAGFREGSYYNPSGGIAKSMMVKRYVPAGEYLQELIRQLNTSTEVVDVVDRPDLTQTNPGPLITRQSAAEVTYLSGTGAGKVKNKVLAYSYLLEHSGTGVWGVNLFSYHSPEALFDETEYIVLKSAQTIKVNPQWASREAVEVNKRAGISSSTQKEISEIISSTFEYRSKSMDNLNEQWSRTILGVEEVYDPATEDTYLVDSGSNHYWIDDRNNIYGTETDENPLPNRDLRQLKIKKAE